MLSVTIVLYRPKRGSFTHTVESLLMNAAEIHSLHILVSGSIAEFDEISDLTRELSNRTSLFLHHRFDNLGFASGHNHLLEEAFLYGADSALILNPDVVLQAGALRLLAVKAREQQEPALLGPTLSRATDDGTSTEFFDSAGIAWTASGRHYDKFQGSRWKIRDGQQDFVSGVTGACLVVGKNEYDHLRSQCGHFFDDLFLAYREDAELGIRAQKLGIASAVIHMEGFAHVRSVRGYERGNRLADLLGVRNRFLLRWSLGAFRPGTPLVAAARDCLVIFACVLVERSSFPGLRDAYSIRRFAKYRGRNWRKLSKL